MSKLINFDPFEEMRSLQRHFFDQDLFSPKSMGMNMPTTDVYTKDDELVVEAHLPNFEDEDVDVSIDKGDLVIRAEKHEKEEDKDKKYMVRESSSSFYRKIRLPERAQDSGVEAHMDEGVLKVNIPLEKLPEPKKIDIKSSKK